MLPPSFPVSSSAPAWWAAVLAGSIVGAALQLQQPALWPVLVYMSFWLAAPVLIAQVAIKNVAMRVALCGLAAALLAFGACGARAARFAADALEPALEGRDIVAVGMVQAMPHVTEMGTRFRFTVESATLDGAPARLPPGIDVGWYARTASDPTADDATGPAPLRAGDRWRLLLRPKAPHGQRNPHGFDYELWLWEQGVQATASVRPGQPAQRLAVTWRHPVERARQAVRDRIYARLAVPGDPAGQRVAGLVAALVTGDQRAIDRADWDVFRATGVAHLVSISGLHITMFAWAAAALVGLLWRRSARLCLALPAPWAALGGGVALATAYAAFSGWGVPSQRTVWMLATFALLRASGVRWPWPRVWLLACALVVAVDPWALLQPGFWLSFVAVGVLFAGNAGQAVEANAMHSIAGNALLVRAGGRFGLKIAALAREQWVVTLALAPLTLLLFGQVSLVGLLANLAAIPWVTLLITPLALLGVLAPPLWDAAAGATAWLVALLEWLARWPHASFTVAQPPLWAGAAGVLGGLLLVARLPPALRALGLPLLLPVLLWQAPRPAAGQFELLAADIGQGNAVLVRTATHTLVYDAGPRYSRESDAGHRVLVPLLRAYGERVDTLLLSHRDTDHTGGAEAVLASQPQAQLLGSLEDGHPLHALRPPTRCEAGQRWRWDGVDFAVLHPPAAMYQATVPPNARSCVLRIAAAGGSALLAGDIGVAQESQLVATGGEMQADVLLVPHHGSKTSSGGVFLDAVQPRWAVVQAGYRNRFGHPAPEVLARYAERGIAVVDSPRCGAAHWRSDAPARMDCERQRNPRYWQHTPP